MRKWLTVIIILGLIASLIQIYYRFQSEVSNKKVEIAFDYRDLVEISSMKSARTSYLFKQLSRLKSQGVTTICISESSLEELDQLRRIEMYSAKQLAILNRAIEYDAGYTYLIFNQPNQSDNLSRNIKDSFARQNVVVQDWEYLGKKGLKISLPIGYSSSFTLLPDETSIKLLQAKGFQIMFKMSNRIKYNSDYAEKMFQILNKYKIKHIMFDGESIPGFISNNDDKSEENYRDLASLIQKYGLGITVVELTQKDVKGLPVLAKLLNHDVVRVHVITETDIALEANVLRDRLVLAVEDRNIRIILLNAMIKYYPDRNRVMDTFSDKNFELALSGEDGVIESLKDAGFTFEEAESFTLKKPPFESVLTILISLGCLALASMLLYQFAQTYVLRFFIVSLICLPLIMLFSETLLFKLLALLAAISAPTLSMIYVLSKLDPKKESVSRAILLFLIACMGSMVGAIFVTGLLFGVSYMVVLNQFSGVNVLHLVPIVLVAVYILFFRGKQTALQRLNHAVDFLKKPVTVLWVSLAAVVGIVGIYYLSRTGNTGQATDIEMFFRQFLKDALGVRPRIKEFLFAHPIFIFAAYLSYRYKYATFLFVLGTMGQLSIVSTFTHLHTPLIVSSLRVLFGMIGGVLIGLLFILIWKLLAKGWNSWLLSIRKS